MAQQQFFPRPPSSPKLDAERIEVPVPLPQPEGTKPPILQRVLPFVMIIAVVGFLVLMVSTSGTLNPFMLMMPLMLLIGVFGLMGNGGSTNGDLNADRRNYFLAVREARTLVHRRGKAMFGAQEASFPQPARLTSLVGLDVPDAPSMWTVRAANPGGFVARAGTPDEKSFVPYLAARLGRGTVEIEPQIVASELPVTEQIEPVTLGAFRRFMRVQRFIAEFPIGYYLGRAPFHSIQGPDERSLSLARAMVASLTFNHSPDELELALVTDDPDDSNWSAFKWLPHANDPLTIRTDGPARRIYRSMADFAADLQESVAQRPPFSPDAGTDPSSSERSYPHLLVIIDLPASQVRLPEPFGASGIDGITLLVVRAGANELPASEEGALLIDESGQISTISEPALITADEMSAAEFTVFARAMSRYRSSRGSSVVAAATSSTSEARRTPYLEALGINDLESFDAEQFWTKSAGEIERKIPIADLIDEQTQRPLGKTIELNFSESSVGGSGPHGALQGKTGSGKSYMIQPAVLSLAARYSPEQVVFILCDFKGGATFRGYDALPHVLANITNLAKDSDVLARMEAVVEGEVTKRQLLFDEYKVEDILSYHKLRAKNPGQYPPLPDLFIVIDEFAEFIKSHRGLLALFASVTKVGRSLGLHLVLVSQNIDPAIIGDIEDNLTFGISLAAETASGSRCVIKSAAATQLKSGAGHAYIRMDGANAGLYAIQGFEVGAPYIPPTEPIRDIGVADNSIVDTDTAGRSIVAFQSFSPDEPVIANAPSTSVDDAQTPDTEHVQVREALFNKLVQFQSIQPRQLWQPTLSAPISFNGGDFPVADERGLRIRIGDLDDPSNHRRIPYTLRPEAAGAHIRVVGDRGTGTSTTLQTIIASAAMTYTPDRVQFYLIDMGSKLREVEHFPNVGARASGTDNEMIDRILAEFKRVVEIRRNEFENRQVATYAAYAASKANAPVVSDPYGEMFLVIDGINEFLNTRQEGTEGQVATQRMATLIDIAKAGGSRGIHLVIAGEYEADKHRFYNEFGLYILHPTDPMNVNQILRAQEAREAFKTMPATQPGRAIEPTTGLHARVFVPQLDPIEPIPGRLPEEYDPTADYSSGIRALGEHLSATSQARAPQIVTVGSMLPWDAFWPFHQSALQAGAPRALLLGVAADSLNWVQLPCDDPRAVPHLLVVGDPQSGRSTVVRSLLRSILAQYRPDEAQVYLLDPAYSLSSEASVLRAAGLLGGHHTRASDIELAAKNIAGTIAERMPDESVHPDTIRAGTWHGGPKLFVIADPITSLNKMYQTSPTDPLVAAIEQQRDLGVSMGLHVIATEQTNQYMSVRNGSAFYKALAQTNSDVLLLSGSTTEPVSGSLSAGNRIAFARRRPGMGQLWSPSTGYHPVIQTFFADEFPASSQGS